MTMVKSETILVQDGDTVVELTGQAKADFLADREATNVQFALLESEYKAKQDARDSAIKKLGEIAGLTKEELDAIL
jgi:ABC-type hemin transport system substrate-binding protein